MSTLQTDYLIIGSGAAGLAFADTLLTETQAHITIVDRHGQPGGHWNDAYAFVGLHQPSAFYGVNSMPLGSGQKDSMGLNQGLYELASGPEISGYYKRVMNQRLLPSGRVSYHPMCNQLDDGSFESLLSGQRTQVQVRHKVVDARYYSPKVPSTHRPAFAVADGVNLVPPNALPGLWHAGLTTAGAGTGGAANALPRHFVVLGAGKTAMDTIIWLLQAGAPAKAITWVMPRDAWLINRRTTQPGSEFFMQTLGSQADQMQALADASSIDDLYLRLEACGALLRIFPDQQPGMFHLATVSEAEVALLRTVRQVVRQGRVLSLEPGQMTLQQGTVAVPAGSLFIDCTASAVEPRPVQPIFQGDKIVLQLVRLPQPAFSAAMIAYVEAHYDTDKQKNGLCGSVPFPHRLQDYPKALMVNMLNQFQWGQDKTLRQWMRDSRLDGFGKMVSDVSREDAEKQAVLMRMKQHAPAAMANAQKLMALAEASA